MRRLSPWEPGLRLVRRRDMRATLLRVAVLAGVVAGGPAAACSEDCGNVDCGSGVSVQWDASDLPEDVVVVRLCIDGECGDTEPPSRSIAPASAPAVDDINVELYLYGPGAEVIDLWDWQGDREGGCCPYVELRPDGSDLTPVG